MMTNQEVIKRGYLIFIFSEIFFFTVTGYSEGVVTGSFIGVFKDSNSPK